MKYSDEWRGWDNRENVVVRSRRTRAGVTDWAVHTVSAKRRALGFKELVSSGGVYTAQDLKWLVPAALVAPLGAMKPGDVIEDVDDVEWIVLDCPLLAERSHYGCMCRNLVIAHDLRDEIDIWSPTNTQDAQGNRTPTFAALHSRIPGRIQPIDGVMIEAFGKQAIAKNYTAYLASQLTVAQELAITEEMQVRINGSTTPYQIKGWRNPGRIDQLFEIDLEIMP